MGEERLKELKKRLLSSNNNTITSFIGFSDTYRFIIESIVSKYPCVYNEDLFINKGWGEVAIRVSLKFQGRAIIRGEHLFSRNAFEERVHEERIILDGFKQLRNKVTLDLVMHGVTGIVDIQEKYDPSPTPIKAPDFDRAYLEKEKAELAHWKKEVEDLMKVESQKQTREWEEKLLFGIDPPGNDFTRDSMKMGTIHAEKVEAKDSPDSYKMVFVDQTKFKTGGMFLSAENLNLERFKDHPDDEILLIDLDE